MKMHTKPQLFKILGILILPLLLLVFPAAALAADTYPSKPVRLIIRSAAGGGTDIVGRIVATSLSERLGRQVIVENIAGGGGVIGTEKVAKAEPDGYTLLFAQASHSTQAALQKLPYDPIKSFTPVARVSSGFFSLCVHPSVPVNSVKELIALAKQKPGQLIFTNGGSGSQGHMGTELFKMMADIDIKIVQFKGGGPAVIDLIGGHSQATLIGLATTLPHVKSGKLKILATGGLSRGNVLPNVPTISESALPGYSITQWFGILAPAGTPATVVDRLNKELKVIVGLDAVKKLLLDDGSEADFLGGPEFGKFIEEDVAKYTSIARKANIKLEE
jgi:tripartite-type tricarboxylate transporter receptor subunit TctC